MRKAMRKTLILTAAIGFPSLFLCCLVGLQALYFLAFKTPRIPSPARRAELQAKPQPGREADEEEAIRAAKAEAERLLPSPNLGPGKARLLIESGGSRVWHIQFGQHPNQTKAKVYQEANGWRVELISVKGALVFKDHDGKWKWLGGPVAE